VSPSLDAFLGAILGEDRPAGAAAFAAAILREHNPDEPGDDKGRRSTGVSYEDWRDAILYGVPEPSGALAADVLREYNFNPDEPRDERGRWTAGGSGTSLTGTSGTDVAATPLAKPAPAGPKVKTIENARYSGIGWWLTGGGMSPATAKSKYGAITPSKILSARTGDYLKTSAGARQGTTIVATDVPDGFLVGSTGADTCIIAIILIPRPKNPGRVGPKYNVVACHFDNADDPASTLAKIGKLPPGTHVAFAGGNGAAASNTELYLAIAPFLFKSGVKIDGYSSGDALWANNMGTYYVFKNEKPK
jgi:hypothetical protein